MEVETYESVLNAAKNLIWKLEPDELADLGEIVQDRLNEIKENA